MITSNNNNCNRTNSGGGGTIFPKFPYMRPEFLQLRTDDEISVSADHQIRPIILPRDVSRLPWRSGYAECINAGKSLRNEDQAASYQDVAIRLSSSTESNNIKDNIPWTYFGIFDGHAGTAVAVAAASQLHNIIRGRLNHVAELLIALEFEDSDNDSDTIDDDETGDKFVDCKSTTSSPTKTDSSGGGGLNSVACQNSNDIDSEDAKTNHRDTSIENNSKASPSIKASINRSQSSSSLDKRATVSPNVVKSGRSIQAINEEVKSTPPMSRGLSFRGSSILQSFATKHLLKKKQDQQQRQQNDKPTSANGQSQTQSQHAQSVSFATELHIPSMIDIHRNNITVDSLITGALEASFWEMDSRIASDKHDYKMPGGCTAIVSIFILGKLYVCNAGDSRAIVCKNNEVIPMSFDFTPTSERERILRLGLQRPEFLGNEFTHLEFAKRPSRRDLGRQMLYKDAYMTGWSVKTITYDDLKFPLVWGEGKRSRVLATIGVTRGFGDHELRAQYGSVLIKPFLTPEPEVRVLELEKDDNLTGEDVLIMGSDGLWDVTSNEEAGAIVKQSFDLFSDNEESRSKYRYLTAAQDLVIHSRGHTSDWNNVWRTNGDRPASMDDIAVFVIPLERYREDYLEWKKLRNDH